MRVAWLAAGGFLSAELLGSQDLQTEPKLFC